MSAPEPRGRPVLHVAGPLNDALAPAALRSLDSAALAAFLAERRWFGAKGAVPRRVGIHDVVPIADAPGAPPLAAIVRLDVELADGRVERYQLPLAVREEQETGSREQGAGRGEQGAGSREQGAGSREQVTPHSALRTPHSTLHAVLADIESADGTRGTLFDATEDAAFRQRVAGDFERGAVYAGEGARWMVQPLEGAAVAGLGAVQARLGGAEQSNTSLLCGDRAILKLYRKLEAGDHPEVEIARFLTTRTTFRHTPALLGTIIVQDRDGASTVAGMLQQLVPGARDAWAVALDAVRVYLRAPGEATPPNPFAGEMKELGRVTRALHDALASNEDDPGFAPRLATHEDVDAWAGRVRGMVTDATQLLAAARADGRLRGADVSVADAVLRRRTEQFGDLDALARAVGDHPGARIRLHGDYHLGQVLKGADGRYVIIDFEGEPARLLAERRAPNAALRDVAGMLRSFAYAAASGMMETGGVGTNPAVELRSARWERAVRDAFLAGYLEAGGAAFLPADPEATTHLLMMFEMEKVYYELAYELNNRPDWVWIPLRGIGRLLGSPSLPRLAP